MQTAIYYLVPHRPLLQWRILPVFVVSPKRHVSARYIRLSCIIFIDALASWNSCVAVNNQDYLVVMLGFLREPNLQSMVTPFLTSETKIPTGSIYS